MPLTLQCKLYVYSTYLGYINNHKKSTGNWFMKRILLINAECKNQI